MNIDFYIERPVFGIVSLLEALNFIGGSVNKKSINLITKCTQELIKSSDTIKFLSPEEAQKHFIVISFFKGQLEKPVESILNSDNPKYRNLQSVIKDFSDAFNRLYYELEKAAGQPDEVRSSFHIRSVIRKNPAFFKYIDHA